MIAWWDSPTPVNPDFIRRQRQDAAAIPLRVWLAVLDEALPTATAYADLQSTLPRLKAPTLLIWGSKDPIMEEPVRQTLRDALPGAQVKDLRGSGPQSFLGGSARGGRASSTRFWAPVASARSGRRLSASSSTSIQCRTGSVVPLCKCWMQPMFADTMHSASERLQVPELASRAARSRSRDGAPNTFRRSRSTDDCRPAP